MKARISPNPAALAAARFSLRSSSDGAPSEKSRGRIVLRCREQPRRVYYASAFGTNKKISATPTAKERKPMQRQPQRPILPVSHNHSGWTYRGTDTVGCASHARTEFRSPTATQAARMPQFASRLHPTGRPASRPNPALARQGSRNGGKASRSTTTVPSTATVYAWLINFGFVVSDSFTVGQCHQCHGNDFRGLATPGRRAGVGRDFDHFPT